MINIFNETYTLLSNSLGSSVHTSSVYTNTPSEYPFVSLEEIGNDIHRSSSDGCNIENCANIDFELNVYTKHPNKKTKADDLLNTIDDLFTNLGFIRTTKMPMPSTDETIYRVVVRYSGVVSKNHTVYRG